MLDRWLEGEEETPVRSWELWCEHAIFAVLIVNNNREPRRDTRKGLETYGSTGLIAVVGDATLQYVSISALLDETSPVILLPAFSIARISMRSSTAMSITTSR